MVRLAGPIRPQRRPALRVGRPPNHEERHRTASAAPASLPQALGVLDTRGGQEREGARIRHPQGRGPAGPAFQGARETQARGPSPTRLLGRLTARFVASEASVRARALWRGHVRGPARHHGNCAYRCPRGRGAPKGRRLKVGAAGAKAASPRQGCVKCAMNAVGSAPIRPPLGGRWRAHARAKGGAATTAGEHGPEGCERWSGWWRGRHRLGLLAVCCSAGPSACRHPASETGRRAVTTRRRAAVACKRTLPGLSKKA